MDDEAARSPFASPLDPWDAAVPGPSEHALAHDDQQEPSLAAPRRPAYPVRAALSPIGGYGSPPRQPSTAPLRVEWSSSGKAGAGKRSWCGRNTCFPPCVSLHLFRSMGFFAERNRPPPAFGCFLGFPPGPLEEGGPPLRAGPLPRLSKVNLDGPAQAGSWSGLRRGGGRGSGSGQIRKAWIRWGGSRAGVNGLGGAKEGR
jgi:hypothetical protein